MNTRTHIYPNPAVQKVADALRHLTEEAGFRLVIPQEPPGYNSTPEGFEKAAQSSAKFWQALK